MRGIDSAHPAAHALPGAYGTLAFSLDDGEGDGGVSANEIGKGSCGRYTVALVARAEAGAWWENLKRAGREKIIRCHEVDRGMFAAALRAVDPSLHLEWITSRPEGSATCRWRIHADAAGAAQD